MKKFTSWGGWGCGAYRGLLPPGSSPGGAEPAPGASIVPPLGVQTTPPLGSPEGGTMVAPGGGSAQPGAERRTASESFLHRRLDLEARRRGERLYQRAVGHLPHAHLAV